MRQGAREGGSLGVVILAGRKAAREGAREYLYCYPCRQARNEGGREGGSMGAVILAGRQGGREECREEGREAGK